jgi:hypothetical protein
VAVDQRRDGLTRVRVGLAGAVAVVVALILSGSVVAVVVQPAWLGFEDEAEANAPIRSMRVSPSRLSFDARGARESLVTLTNPVTSPIVIRSVRLSGSDRAAFDVDRGLCGDVLQPGQSCDMTVRFVPPHSGTFAGNVVIQSDVGPAREVPVAGTAAL